MIAPPSSEVSELRMPPTSVENRKVHKTLSKLALLLAVLAVLSTCIATTSDEIILQVLSQTELVRSADRQEKLSSSSLSQHNGRRIAFVQEPYGYSTIMDDSSKAGFMTYISRACFYEYRLPRAFLKVSQHREELTLKESEDLQFRAGVRKRPRGWQPFAPDRNVFLEEPYRDKTIDRLFKRSHRKINKGLVMGILSMLGIALLCHTIHHQTEDHNNTKHATTSQQCMRNTHCNRIRNRFSTTMASTAFCNSLWRCVRTQLVVGLSFVVLVVVMVIAGILPIAAMGVLLRNDNFCGKQCASSSLEASTVLEVDACIEKCVLGTGGKLAMLASCVWFLEVAMAVTILVISTIVVKAPSVSSSLSRRWWWWTKVCLPISIRPEQLCPMSLPLSLHEEQRLRLRQE